MKDNFRRYFLTNTASNYVFIFLRLGLAILSVPIYLHTFGEVQYGVFLLSMGLISSLSFLDLGAGKSLVRYTAEFKVHANKEIFRKAIKSSVSLICIAIGISALVFFLLAQGAPAWFHIPDDQNNIATSLFLVAGVGSIILLLDMIPMNILQGYGVFHRRNLLQLPVILLQVGLVIWVRYAAPDILLYAWIFIIPYVLQLIIDLFMVRALHIIPAHAWKPTLHPSIFKTNSFTYAREIFIIALIAFFSSQTDKFIISAFIGVHAVTIYAIITRPYFLLKSMYGNFWQVIQPEMAKANTGHDMDKLKNIVIGSGRLSITALTTVCSLCIFFFQPLLTIWLQEKTYNDLSAWGALALINLLLSSFYASVYRAMYVIGKTAFIMRSDLIAVILNVIVSILLTWQFGFYGVLIGTTVQMIVLLYLFRSKVQKILHLDLREIFSFPILVLIGISIVICLLGAGYPSYVMQHYMLLMPCLFIFFALLLILLFRKDTYIRAFI